MPAVTFSCPECNAVLRTGSPIAAGKKIRCPTCNAVFVMPEQAAPDLASSVRERPAPPGAVTTRPRLDGGDGNGVAVPPKPSRKGGERPKKAKSAGSSKGLLVGLAVLGLLLLAGAGVGAYFLWFHGVNRGSGQEDPLAYVPPNMNVFWGADYPALVNDPDVGPALERTFRQRVGAGGFFDGLQKEAGLDYKEACARVLVVMNSEDGARAAASGGLNPVGAAMGGGRPPGGRPGGAPVAGALPVGTVPEPTPQTVILKTSKPFSQRQVAGAAQGATRKELNGRTYYDITEPGYRTLFMPSDRLIVLSHLPADQLGAVIGADGSKPAVPPDTVALIGAVNGNPLWAVARYDDSARKTVGQAAAQEKQVRDLTALLDKAKGGAFWGSTEGDRINLGLSLTFGDPAAADEGARAVQAAWLEQQKELDGVLGLFLLLLPKTKQAYQELTKNLHFSADETTAKVTTSVSRPSLSGAMKEVDMLRMGGGLPDGGPPGGGIPLPPAGEKGK
jgi:hypothetical protein